MREELEKYLDELVEREVIHGEKFPEHSFELGGVVFFAPETLSRVIEIKGYDPTECLHKVYRGHLVYVRYEYRDDNPGAKPLITLHILCEDGKQPDNVYDFVSGMSEAFNFSIKDDNLRDGAFSKKLVKDLHPICKDMPATEVIDAFLYKLRDYKDMTIEGVFPFMDSAVDIFNVDNEMISVPEHYYLIVDGLVYDPILGYDPMPSREYREFLREKILGGEFR